MKLKSVTFKNAVTVLQLFRNIYTYGKDQKSFEERKQLAQWKLIPSKSGFVLNNELYLPQSILNEPHFDNCTLLTIEDNNNEFHHTLPNIYPYKTNQCFQQAQHVKLDIFNLQLTTQIEMHLAYGYFEIGIPERENFSLGVLHPHQPMAIKINGKTDASLTDRRERMYKEQHYIYENMGTFRQCYLLKEPSEPIVKKVPEAARTIDLLKPLW